MRVFSVFIIVVIILTVLLLSLLCFYKQRLSETILQTITYSVACFRKEVSLKSSSEHTLPDHDQSRLTIYLDNAPIFKIEISRDAHLAYRNLKIPC
jgi:hypothetical protein